MSTSLSSCFHELSNRVLTQPALTARLFAHPCGLEVLCLECSDPENMFAVGIPTPPRDNTGVAHILEHAVLDGSQRYPVKDPFMEMIKTSMATFINALTYNDYTAYPIASVVPVDFFNLAAVYWDAVFAPLLTCDSFRQEGWRLELARSGDLKSPLITNGIVLNEMRAAESELENILEKEISRRLLPSTNRACNAGGLPEDIVNLTYQEFLTFHRQHYHPTRAKIFFYGNIPTADKLDFVAENLARFNWPPPPQPLLPRRRQTRWQKPRQSRVPYTPILAQAQNAPPQAAWAKAFFLFDELNPLLNVAFTLLEHLLLGHDAAPLRQQILASGLTENILSSGFDNESPEAMFKICLNGCQQQDFPAIGKLVNQGLAHWAETGFSTAQVKAALQQLQLEQREIDHEQCLQIMENVFDAWCLGADPMLFLEQAPIIRKVEEKLQQEPQWLQKLLKKFLVDNQHQLTIELIPDQLAATTKQKANSNKLRKIKAGLSLDALKEIDLQASKLRQRQNAGNSKEDLATLPRLRREDIPATPYQLPVEDISIPGQTPLLRIDLPSNGIAYLQLAFPLTEFPAALLPQLNSFLHLFRHLGTAQSTYEHMANSFAAAGANFSLGIDTAGNLQSPGQLESFLTVRLAVLSESFTEALPLFRQRLHQTIFTERDYIHELLRQAWSSLRDDLVEHGSVLATVRAGAGLSNMHDLHESWFGITGARTCRHQAKHYLEKTARLTAIWENLAYCLRTTQPQAAAIIGTHQQQQQTQDFLAEWPAAKCEAPKSISQLRSAKVKPTNGRREAVPIAGDVSFCAQVCSAPPLLDQDSAALTVYAHLLSCGWLWDEIRLQGGAYGAGCTYLGHLGALQLQSLHDPNPARTYDIFAQLPKLPQTWNQEDIDAAIIACSKYDSVPIRPAAAGGTALKRQLFGITENFRTEFRQRLLSLTPEQISQAAARLWQNQNLIKNNCAIAPGRLTAKMNFKTVKI